MNPVLKKWLLWSVGSCLVLLVTAIVAPLLIHPNQYRAPIASLVKGVTGRQLTIGGEVGLAIFPSLELILRDLSLADGPEFGDTPMARADTLVVGVKLLPLLGGRVEMDRAELKGLSLRLLRDEQGRANWEALMAHLEAKTRELAPVGTPVSGPADSGAEPLLNRLLALSAGGVDLVNATILWQDRRANHDLRLENLELKTGPMHPNRPLAVTAGFRLFGEKDALTGRVDVKYQMRTASGGRIWIDGLEVVANAAMSSRRVKEIKARLNGDLAMDWKSLRAEWSRLELATNLWSDAEWLRELRVGFQGRAEMDLASGRLAAPQSQFTVAIKANALPPAGVQLRLVSDLSGDPQLMTLAMDDLEIEGPAGLRIRGEWHTREGFAGLEGSLAAERFDFRALLIALGRTIPASTDAKVCSGAEFDVDFAVDGQGVRLSRLAFGMDDSHLNGSVKWGFQGPTLGFDGEVDTLDLDRFLPLLVGESTSSGKASKSEASPESGIALLAGGGWLERIARIGIDGRGRVGQVHLAGNYGSGVEFVLASGQGEARLDPLVWSAHGGRLAARLVVDQRQSEPRLTLVHAAEGVRTAELSQEWTGWSALDGEGAWLVRLEAQGKGREALLRTLNGEVQAQVSDGVLSGVDVIGKIRHGHAQFSRGRAPASGAEETRFVSLSTTANIREGILNTNTFDMRAPGLKISGSGQVDWIARRIEGQWQADVATALQGVGVEVDKSTALALPITLRAPFDGVKKWEFGAVDFSRLVPAARMGGGEEESEKPAP
ncbi:MAG: AsmA family protein [Magnetococcales bacterium]|nr:AsmA family protein [Magnetococcales bacterium]